MSPELSSPNSSIEHVIAHEIQATPRQIRTVIRLMEEGATVPFIARYRKEATGGLTDTHLRLLAERLEFLRDLEKRRQEIAHSIEDQGKMSDALRAQLSSAATKAELEDLYLPFRPKKQDKALEAREAGLEALADRIQASPEEEPAKLAEAYVDAARGVSDAAAALEGAREIWVQRFAEDARLLGDLRKKFWSEGWIVSSVQAAKKDEAEKFSDYFSFRERIATIPAHRVMALLRGRHEGALRVALEPSLPPEGGSAAPAAVDAEYPAAMLERFGIRLKRRPGEAWLLEAARRAWRFKARLHLEIDLMMELRRRAESESIAVFAQNLRSLLLAAPAGPRPTMGLDPGFRTGVKVAVVDATGKVAAVDTIYPHEPQSRWEDSLRALEKLVRAHKTELIAIGNGTASRETDRLVGELLRRCPDLKAQKAMVSEAGASVYSASELASKELAGMDVSLRGAVSIARRLQDPLAELVKIDPKAIGVGQYQHDVNQRRLEQSLRGVVEDCVNLVGVDANTASPALLSYVAGLSPRGAESLVLYRQSYGGFRTRAEFLRVPGIDAKTFEQAAGFLRIRGGDHPLDASAVHPEAYPVVERILRANSRSLEEVLGNGAWVGSLKAEDYADETFGTPTVEDILDELAKPGRDPRPDFRTARFKEGVCDLQDLKVGMQLEGVVTNVANFGAFVDIGVHQDGLVHISQLSDRYVKDPQEVVRAGQVVRVKVLEIDLPRQRVALSMRLGPARTV